MAGVSGSRPTNRRGRADMALLRDSLRDIVEANNPATVRQIFYLAVGSGLIEKTESEYKATVVRLLSEMRRSGEVPYHWLVDYTRVMRKPRSYGSLQDALTETARLYRRDIWPGLGCRVEIWTEKETLSGVLLDETYRFDVPLMPTRGYPSLSFIHAAADEIKAANVPTFIYSFGDHDPSGVDIPQVVERGLREYAPGAEIYFERLAVQPWQIDHYGLQTRPTKRTDTRSRGFVGESVEVDSIPPAELRRLCHDAISQHIPAGMLEQYELVEAQERGILETFAIRAA